MITKEQYEQLIPHRDALSLLDKCGEWVGGSALYDAYDSIAGGKTKTGCKSCMMATVISALNMVKRYEESM